MCTHTSDHAPFHPEAVIQVLQNRISSINCGGAESLLSKVSLLLLFDIAVIQVLQNRISSINCGGG